MSGRITLSPHIALVATLVVLVPQAKGDPLDASAQPVSPSAAEGPALIAESCPTFSWGATADAERYEIVIYDAQWNPSMDHDEQAQAGRRIREIGIDAPATGWTPSGEHCLEDGVSYVWFVRAETAVGKTPWSRGALFDIDFGSDALSEVVRRELALQLQQPEVWRDVIQTAVEQSRVSRSLFSLSARRDPLKAPVLDDDSATRVKDQSPSSLTFTAPRAAATSFPNPAALKTTGPNGVVFGGGGGQGGIPAEGAGTRLMWYPAKAAFRGGSVSSTQWDDSNVGQGSFAFGQNAKANGALSAALGAGATAGGQYSVAIGFGATAEGYGAFALGFSSTADGAQSLAHGDGSWANASHAVAFGVSATASGDHAIALGNQTSATGEGSVALGGDTTASGYYSTALGVGTTASNISSTSAGYNSTASGAFSIAIGSQVEAKSAYEMVVGSRNTDYAPVGASVWNDEDRLFVIGNGNSTVGDRDAMVVYKSGDAELYGDLSITGTASKPGGGTWTNSSDARLKEITGPYLQGLAAIKALQPVRFHYKAGNARGHRPEPEYVGFIAQDVQQVIPEAVSEGADGFLDLNMHAVNVALVNAVKALNTQNEGLRNQLEATQRDLAQLREEQNQLTARLHARLSSLESVLAAMGQTSASRTELALTGQARPSPD